MKDTDLQKIFHLMAHYHISEYNDQTVIIKRPSLEILQELRHLSKEDEKHKHWLKVTKEPEVPKKVKK